VAQRGKIAAVENELFAVVSRNDELAARVAIQRAELQDAEA
jgi:hypothetical protein